MVTIWFIETDIVTVLKGKETSQSKMEVSVPGATHSTGERHAKATSYSSDCSFNQTVLVQVMLEIFSVNIELAQKICSNTLGRLDEGLESWRLGIKDEGHLFQCSTLLLHRSKQRRGNTTLYVHANKLFHTAHSLSHLRTYT